MNKVVLIGNLVRENEVRTSTNGNSVLKNAIAVRRNFKDENGEYQSDFINIIAFKNTATFMEKYTSKGSKVAIEGKIQTGSYLSSEGIKKYTFDVIVENVEFMDKKEVKVEVDETKEDTFKDFGNEVQIDDSEFPF